MEKRTGGRERVMVWTAEETEKERWRDKEIIRWEERKGKDRDNLE